MLVLKSAGVFDAARYRLPAGARTHKMPLMGLVDLATNKDGPRCRAQGTRFSHDGRMWAGAMLCAANVARELFQPPLGQRRAEFTKDVPW